MEFEKRLSKAIERGQRRSDEKAAAKAAQALNDEELKRLHSKYRLELSEHIENCLKSLPGHFPGFEFQSVVDHRGWGAAVSRDDVAFSGGTRDNAFSRLEVLVQPHGEYHVLDLQAKGTIRNRETFHRKHFERLAEADLTSFKEFVDLWILEFAELFAASE